MKTISFIAFAALLSFSSCAHKSCCKGGDQMSCSKDKKAADHCDKTSAKKDCCDDDKCDKKS